ncbi:MAG TPA: GspH/FimT family pseudopilin [Dongiaceae bacterium]|nr:GspH/FimT family pseudopilin [Dongiaceae bacterium]
MHLDLANNRLRRGQRGYSLVELLLTMSLLLLFTGLAVVSIDALNQRSTLTEGAIRFETLLRFARAEAAQCGRRVRISFVQDTNEVETITRPGTNQVGTTTQLNLVEVTWEPNPAGQPEVFEDLPKIQWGVDQVNEMVGVSGVRLVENAEFPPATDEEDGAAPDDATPEDAGLALPPSITFNPNGSCDSAEITLAERGTEDRRVIVRIEGVTGNIWRLDPSQKDGDSSPDAQPPSGLPAPPQNKQAN